MLTSLSELEATITLSLSWISLPVCTSSNKRALYIGELMTTDVKPAAAPRIIKASSNNMYLRMSLPTSTEGPDSSPVA